MKRIILLGLLVVSVGLLVGCDAEVSGDLSAGGLEQSRDDLNLKKTEPLVILALGDSLTEGLGVKKTDNYPAILEQALKAKGFDVKVVNSGLSGETSSGLKSRLDWVLQLKPDLTILNIGANDAMRGLPLDLTHSNIENIIERIEQAGSQVIFAGMQIYDNLGREYVAGFKDMYPEIAQQHGLLMIPFFLEHVAGDPQLNQNDMIHPNAAGYQIIVEQNILPVVLPVVEKLAQVEVLP